jgi:hypothetical protein
MAPAENSVCIMRDNIGHDATEEHCDDRPVSLCSSIREIHPPQQGGEGRAIMDQTRVTSGYDVEVAMGGRYLQYLLLLAVETGQFPLEAREHQSIACLG